MLVPSYCPPNRGDRCRRVRRKMPAHSLELALELPSNTTPPLSTRTPPSIVGSTISSNTTCRLGRICRIFVKSIRRSSSVSGTAVRTYARTRPRSSSRSRRYFSAIASMWSVRPRPATRITKSVVSFDRPDRCATSAATASFTVAEVQGRAKKSRSSKSLSNVAARSSSSRPTTSVTHMAPPPAVASSAGLLELLSPRQRGLFRGVDRCRVRCRGRVVREVGDERLA